MSYSEGESWGWCKACEQMRQAADADALECPDCGERMVASARMNQTQRDAAAFSAWMAKVIDEGKWGQSPGGAAAELKCSRANIDMLVAAGVLERSDYDMMGGKIIIISQRSVEKAKRNKKETGSWNPRGSGNA
jgi:rRNA maturation endonuclease Nob1